MLDRDGYDCEDGFDVEQLGGVADVVALGRIGVQVLSVSANDALVDENNSPVLTPGQFNLVLTFKKPDFHPLEGPASDGLPELYLLASDAGLLVAAN